MSVSDSAATARRREIFVDRETEFQRLEQALREPPRGRPRVVVVSGQEGVGKTALAERFTATLPGVRVLRATGAEDERDLPYGVLGQLLTRPATELPGDALAGELARDGDAGRPVVILDDVQWADHASLEAVSYALRRLRDGRTAVLMIVRDVADPGVPGGIRRLFHADGTVRLPLAGLDAGAVADLCAQLTGRLPTRRAAQRLWRHTRGTPLHVRALLGQVTADALEDLDTPLPAPRPLVARVLADLAGCGRAGRDLVAAAAVLGERGPLHAAAELAQAGDPLAALEEAIDAGLLREEIGTGELSFPCPLIRAAVYQGHLGPSRRAALHRRAAELAQDPAARLWHRGLGAVGPDRELAAELAGLGRRRAAEGDWTEATRHLSAATLLAPSAPERHRLTLEAAEGRIVMGTARPGALLPQVAGLPVSAWRAYVLALLKLEAGRTHEAAPLLQDAWHQAADATLAAKVAAQTALLRLLDGDARAAAEWSARAHPAHFDVTRCATLYALDPLTAADLLAIGTATPMRPPGDTDGKALRSPDSHGGAGPARLPAPASASPAELEALLGRARLRAGMDDLAGAVRDLDGILAASAPLPLRLRLLAHVTLAEAEYRLGTWDDALTHGERALALAADAEHALLSPLCHAAAVLVLAARGEWEAAEAHLGPARATESALIRAHAAAAEIHLAIARGKPEIAIAAARGELAPATCHHDDAGRETAVPPLPGSPCADLVVDALVAVGRLDEAAATLAGIEERAAGRPSRIAAAARARGNLHAARREPDRAKTAYERSLALLAGLGTPFHLARTQLDYGAFLRRQGKRALAAEHLERAHATLATLRARPYLERCTRELAACGVGQAPRTAGPVQAALTTQEFAIAGHAARGLTNRQIARELALSVKTVEYHLGHIYLKLRIRSRAQLAVRLTQS